MPFLIPLVIPALIGAGTGAGIAAATGGDVTKGALFGAAGGAVFGAFAPAGSLVGTPAGTLPAGVAGPLTPATTGLFGTGGAGTLAATGKTLSILSVLGGTILGVGAGRDEDATAKAIAERNAANLRVQAAQEELVVREEQKRLTKEKVRRISRLRLLAANAGISLVGTPLLQTETVAGEFEEERRFIRQGGKRRRFGLEFRAGQQELRARSISRTSRFRTGTTILTGVGQAASLLN